MYEVQAQQRVSWWDTPLSRITALAVTFIALSFSVLRTPERNPESHPRGATGFYGDVVTQVWSSRLEPASPAGDCFVGGQAGPNRRQGISGCRTTWMKLAREEWPGGVVFMSSLRWSSYRELDGRGSTWRSSNLGQSDFTDADLRGSVFARSNLEDTYFKRADLRGATFREADLRNVSFDGADLRGAWFDEVDAEGASWAGATCPDGTPAALYRGSCRGHMRPALGARMRARSVRRSH